MRCCFLLIAILSSASWANQDYLTCPDGRKIPTELKGSREQRAATANLNVKKIQKSFSDLPGWQNKTEPASLFSAVKNNCKGKKLPVGWQSFCENIPSNDGQNIHALIEQYFTPYQVVVEGSDSGKFTSYYAPYINVSRVKEGDYQHPLYKGSDTARTLSRTQLDNGALPDDEVLFWADNYLDTFLLHVQGSGVGKLPDGSKVSILYDSKNRHNYVSIGKTLIQCGDVPAEIMSLPAIKAWVDHATEQQTKNLVYNNQSYVFFREEKHEGRMPVGALNVRLTAMRSMAVDKRYIALGSMTYISVPNPIEDTMIQRAFLAQDIGGAINGGIRADIFAGEGNDAEAFAGSMAHSGQLWVLEPTE